MKRLGGGEECGIQREKREEQEEKEDGWVVHWRGEGWEEVQTKVSLKSINPKKSKSQFCTYLFITRTDLS